MRVMPVIVTDTPVATEKMPISSAPLTVRMAMPGPLIMVGVEVLVRSSVPSVWDRVMVCGEVLEKTSGEKLIVLGLPVLDAFKSAQTTAARSVPTFKLSAVVVTR